MGVGGPGDDMRPAPCVVSVVEHTGWAHVVCVAAHGNAPAVIARRRVVLIDQALPTLPYEHETTATREDEADAVLAGVWQSIAARTSDALRRVVIELAPSHIAIALAIRESPFDDLPATVAAVRTSYRPLCAADGMLYQLAICRAARQLKLDVHMCGRGGETARAAQRVGVTPAEIEEFVSRTGRPAGTPVDRRTGGRTLPQEAKTCNFAPSSTFALRRYGDSKRCILLELATARSTGLAVRTRGYWVGGAASRWKESRFRRMPLLF